MDFLFTVRLGNPKNDLQNCSSEQRSSFCWLCVPVQDSCRLKDSFSNPFSDFPIEWWKWKSKNRYLIVEIRFRISRAITNPKSGFENLNLDFPIERTLKILFRCTTVFKLKTTKWLYKSQRIFIYAVQKQASLAVQNSHSMCWLQQLFWSKKRKQIY